MREKPANKVLASSRQKSAPSSFLSFTIGVFALLKVANPT